jgi:hypothetical protein
MKPVGGNLLPFEVRDLEAKKTGAKERAFKIAKKLLKSGLSVEEVSDLTELPFEGLGEAHL